MTLDRWRNARQRGTGRTAAYRVERLHDGRLCATIRCNGIVRTRVGEATEVRAWVDKIIDSRNETAEAGGIW